MEHSVSPSLPSRRRKHESEELDEPTPKRTATPVHMKASVGFNDLPDEILLKIVELIHDDSEQDPWKRLSNLSWINRKFHRVVNEKIYENYDYGLDPFLFLRTLVSKPELAALVKKVRYSFLDRELEYYGPIDGDEVRKNIPSDSDKEMINKKIKLSGYKKWKELNLSGSNRQCQDEDLILGTEDDDFFAAILMHTPNIRELQVYIDDHHFDPHGRWLELLENATCNPLTGPGRLHTFEHLRVVNVCCTHGLHVADLAPLFKLRSLKHLLLRRLYVDVDPDDIGQNFPASCNDIEKMELIGGFISMDVLALLVSTPRHLKALTLDFSYNQIFYPNEREWRQNLGSGNLSKVLDRIRDSVEEIYLDWSWKNHSEDDSVGWYNAQWYNVHPGLRRMTALKRLVAPYKALFGARLSDEPVHVPLPPSLEYLQLNSTNLLWYERALKPVVAFRQSGHVPMLRNILIDYDDPNDFRYHDYTMLAHDFSKLDITLRQANPGPRAVRPNWYDPAYIMDFTEDEYEADTDSSSENWDIDDDEEDEDDGDDGDGA